MKNNRIVKKGKSKFNNKKCEEDGIIFDSMKERHHYNWLKNYCKNNDLNLETQKTYKLCVCKYIADFVVTGKGKEIIIDTKVQATVTDLFKIKAKLMKHDLGKEVFKAFSLPALSRKLREVFG